MSVTTLVNDTLAQQGLRSSEVSRYAQPVINALEAREAEIVAGLREVATDKGLSESQANEILVGVGLVEIPVEPEEPTPGWARALTDKVDALSAFARRHGFRG